MATKKTEAKDETALTKAATTAMAAPDFIEQGAVGTENIHAEDVLLPRLALSQKMSPEVDEMQPEKFIDGLRVGQFFNNVSRIIYGAGPLQFIVLRVDRPRGIQFKPIEEGGGIVDFNVPLDDPRMQWGNDGAKPVATKFYEFVVMLYAPGEERHGEIIVLSLKSTGIKVARKLNSMILARKKDGRPVPLYSGLYEVKAGIGQSKQGPFATYEVANAGWVPDVETYNAAKEFHETLKGKTIAVDRDAQPDPEGDPGPEGDGKAPF